MTKEQLIEKYGLLLFQEVAFIEDNLMNMPIYAKENMIMHNCEMDKVQTTMENVQNALRDYQHYREL